jgi:hypothetical protein
MDTEQKNLIYSRESVEVNGKPSIFLAGPSPRNVAVLSWRPMAIKMLSELKFDGFVVVPEYRDQSETFGYISQVEWENEALEKSTLIMFWVPRDLDSMPAFTTNVEFGRYVGRKPVVYGRPDASPKNAYLDWYYEKSTGNEPLKSLQETVEAAVKAAVFAFSWKAREKFKFSEK